MKLRSIHLFGILLTVLILSSFFGTTIESMTEGPVDPDPNPNPNPNNQGIPYNDIPKGSEDLYILKSQIVTPTCPIGVGSGGPTMKSNSENKTCPSCPPCGRCPESAFECKKVPNYKSKNDKYLPTPLLNDFSRF